MELCKWPSFTKFSIYFYLCTHGRLQVPVVIYLSLCSK